MSGTLCKDRVAIVTGAGRGLGREYALMLARQGAKVVVNDLGGTRDGSGASESPAQEVVNEIEAAGGEAVANGADVSNFDEARAMIRQAVDTFGKLDVLVNNAGILRDRMLFNMSESDWDAVIQVHLKGTFAPARHAAEYWRERAKAGETLDARLINTTSVSGIYGNAGQSNYGAAKAGIAAFTIIVSRELGRYGVTVNCIAPAALTRLTEDIMPQEMTEEMKAAQDPKWVAPIVTWLASHESRGITGRVFESQGTMLAVAEGWHRGPTVEGLEDPAKLGSLVRDIVGKARLNAGMNGKDLDGGLG